jgi:hypothetical protein
MTADEIRALDAYCRERHVDLVPNQNSLGHMERWLALERYRPLAECPDGWRRQDGGWTAPTTVCPLDERVPALYADLYDQLLPNFGSAQCNVGLDEPWELGRGRSRDEAERRGVGRVYLDHALTLREMLHARGRTMQFWGDIILKHEQIISELPDDVLIMNWGYGAEHPFDAECPKFAKLGLPFYVCPGTGSWNAVGGRTRNAVRNLENAISNGRANGARGVLITDWGDNGHWQPLPVSYLGYAYGLALAWAGEANRELDLPRALDVHAFADEAGVLGRLAYDLGNVSAEEGLDWGNAHKLFQVLRHPEAMRESPPPVPAKAAEGARRRLAALAERLAEARPRTPDGDLVREEFRWAIDMLRYGCAFAAARDGAEGAEAPDPGELIERYRRVWRARNREGGLEDSIGKMQALL